MEIYERIRILRKDNLKMSMEAFGRRLGVSRDVINNIEHNRLAKPEQKLSLFKLICKEFSVSEEWLLNGTGDMFASNEAEYSALTDQIITGENEFAKNIFKTFALLEEEEWETLQHMIETYLAVSAESDTDTAAADELVEETKEYLETAYKERKTMSEFLMKPKIDFAFKEIMMNETARIGFLSAILKLNPKDIKETRLLNTNLRKVHEDDKQGILDVRLLLNNNTEIDIEIQLSELKVWADRSLFYLSKMYVEQISKGQDYAAFKKCVSISILNFELFKEEPDFYSCFHIREDTRHTIYTDKMEFHVLELPKLPPELKEDSSDILLWAKFINAERKEEFDMLATKNPYIKSAYHQLQVISQDKEKRLEYEAREKAVRDHNQLMREAEERGRESGKEIGKEIGKELGKEIGKEIVAKNMLKLGLSIDIIMQSTGLPKEQIEALQKEPI